MDDELLLLLTAEDETTATAVEPELDNSSVEEGPSPESPVSDITHNKRPEEIRKIVDPSSSHTLSHDKQ